MTDEAHRGSRAAEEEMRDVQESAEPVAGDMERRSEELKKEIKGVERDWERKARDGNVPGAQRDLEDVETHREEIGKSPDEDEDA